MAFSTLGLAVVLPIVLSLAHLALAATPRTLTAPIERISNRSIVTMIAANP
jgi:hypothetical protein